MLKFRPGSATERFFSLFSLTHGLREEIGVSVRSVLFGHEMLGSNSKESSRHLRIGDVSGQKQAISRSIR